MEKEPPLRERTIEDFDRMSTKEQKEFLKTLELSLPHAGSEGEQLLRTLRLNHANKQLSLEK